MFKYSNKYGVMGMAGKCEVLGDFEGLRKNKNKVVSFSKDFNPNSPIISYSYIYEKPSAKGYMKCRQITSKLDKSFFKLEGGNFREIRETRNKFNKIITIKEYKKEDVLELIDRWDAQSGKKYGWQRHSGYDRAFFNRWYDSEKENLISRFYYIDDRIVGYSVLHKESDNYTYIIRKADNTIRNTCLYVDYKTFEEIYNIENKDFYVNWGASSGTLLKYKRKFGSFEETDVYFYSIKTTPN